MSHIQTILNASNEESSPRDGKSNPLNEYEIDKILGSGSFGIVYRCKYTPNESIVAVKVLFNYGIPTPKIQQCFENEYKILKNKVPPHKNIVRFLREFTDTPTYEMISMMEEEIQQSIVMENKIRKTQFVVFEYHPINMKDFLSKERTSLRPSDKVKICSQIANALAFLFKHRIIHRDIKLDNILLSSDNSPILCDFGMAIKTNEKYIGRAEVPCGNPSHMAPEVSNQWAYLEETSKDSFYLINYGKQPSWELGVICFEIAVGEHPFGTYPLNCGSPNLCVNKVDVSLLDKLKDFPDEFKEILQGLVENNPETRMEVSEVEKIMDALLVKSSQTV